MPWAKTETLGATIKFSFDGTILAIEHGLLSASAMYEIYIDGKIQGVGNPYYGGRPLTDLPQPVMGFSTFTLPEGHHKAEIKTIKSTDENSIGNHVFLYNIITGRPVR